jgi:hypothetical protein
LILVHPENRRCVRTLAIDALQFGKEPVCSSDGELRRFFGCG